MAATIFRYDNKGTNLGVLPYDTATHEEALDGTDKLTAVTTANPSKRDRLVWQDDGGVWHEHMVDSVKRTHAGKGARAEVVCSNSISELYGTIANGTKIRADVRSILNSLLSNTRWQAGPCDDFGVVEIEVYHKSVRECIAELCELCKGELETDIKVYSYGVDARWASIVRERGSKTVLRQFQYGRNVSSIMREVAADEVYTAVKGYGAKLNEDDKSDYPARLEVSVQSNADLTRWGVLDGNGIYTHNYTTYTDAQCTSRQFLLTQCRSLLKSVSKPLVRYEFDTADVDVELWSDVRLGDRVMCVDELFNPTLELIERVSQIRRNLRGRVQCRIAIGERANPILDQFKAAEKTARKSTGNSSKVASRSPVSTRGGGYDGEGAPSIGSGEAFPYTPDPSIDPVTQMEPQSIRVTTPPTKTEYYDGDKIDYSGIVVTLYNSDGSVYTDDWHPDGVAAFNELDFPQQYAMVDGEYKQGTVKASQLDNIYQQPAPIAFGYAQVITRYTSSEIYEKSELSGDFTAIGCVYSNSRILVVMASKSSNSINEKISRKRYTPGTETDNPEGDYEIAVERQRTLDLSYTIDGKKVYFSILDTYFVGYGDVSPNATCIGSITNSRGKIAWAIVYGDIENISSPTNLTVNWTRKDEQVLSTSFPITVNKPTFTSGEAWGGGEGDAYSTSGGGDF